MNLPRLLKTACFTGLAFGVSMGLFFALRFGSATAGILGGVFSGVFFGITIAAFAEVQAKRMKVKPGGEFEGEPVLHQGPANHFLNREGRGGWLTLTPTKLAFRSHGKNIQNDPVDINLADITEAHASRTIGIIPNGLRVRLESRKTETFVVHGREVWADAIRKARLGESLLSGG